MLGKPQRSKAVRLSAVFDPLDACYRYRLRREFDAGHGTVNFILCNGSAADAAYNDATVSKCEFYTQAWGYANLEVTNLYGAMARHPEVLFTVFAEPVGSGNDVAIREAAEQADIIVAGWSDVAIRDPNRANAVLRLLQPYANKLHVLRLNISGWPAHPIYLPKTLRPHAWHPVLYNLKPGLLPDAGY